MTTTHTSTTPPHTANIDSSSTTATDFGLTYEQEACLKKQLMKIVVQKELENYIHDTSSISSTLFLSFLKQQLMIFPLLDSREKAREKLEELIQTLPQLLSVTQKATKHDIQDNKIRVFVVSFFNLAIRTTKERQHDMRLLEKNFNPDTEADVLEITDPQEKYRKTTALNTGAKLSHLAHSIFNEMEKDDGVSNFFKMMRNAQSLDQLSPLYQSAITLWGRLIAIAYEKKYSDANKVKMLKRMHVLTPTHAIKALLKMADPLTLLQGLIKLLFAKPFGTHNLVQKWAEVASEMKRTKTRLAEAHVRAHNDIKWIEYRSLKALLDWFHKHANETVLSFQEEVFDENNEDHQYQALLPADQLMNTIRQSNALTAKEYEMLPHFPQDVALLREILLLEIRLKEKHEFVELLGTPKIIEIMKEVIPIFYGPFSAFFCKSDISHQFEEMVHSTRDFVKASKEAANLPIEERVAVYEQLARRDQGDTFTFLHNATLNDDGGIEHSIQWYVNFLQFVHSRPALDIQSLMIPLSEQQRSALSQELDATIAYWKLAKEGRAQTHAPMLQIVPLLVPGFCELMKGRLDFHKSQSFQQGAQATKQ
eukprot:TRINITY_DN864_c0_g1_i1.p1 TRINITY_DN864_c0_g1~~TRINITY_DN864_c0_g1_i1.p1  ORF type:complete len:594 (-),score=92.81 TRINITY_DN864_c0_g1_i1:111-1892(-)